MSDKKKQSIMIIAVVVTMICVSVGYTLSSSKINLTNATTMINKIWDVKLATISSVQTEGYGKNLSSSIENDFEAKFNIQLNEIGDKVTYTINVKNEGNIDAILKDIDLITKTKTKDIVYKIEGLDEGDILKPGESQMFTLSAKYNENAKEQKVLTNEITLILEYEK